MVRFVTFWTLLLLAEVQGGLEQVRSMFFTRVLTNFHRERAAAFRVMREKLFELPSITLTSIKIRALAANLACQSTEASACLVVYSFFFFSFFSFVFFL